MDQRPWQRDLKRAYMRGALKRYQRNRFRHPPTQRVWPNLLVSAAIALFVAIGGIQFVESRLSPILELTAQAKTQNQISQLLEHAISNDLMQRHVSYSDFITIQRDEQGNITALSTDMAKLNLLRSEMISVLLDTLAEIHVSDLEIPLGSLIDSEFLWARGPSIKVHALRIGTVEAEFRSEFTSAGVNQTQHRVLLEWNVPVTVLLPGKAVDVPIQTQLCVAETIIVGRVPETYLGYPINNGITSEGA